MKVYDDISCPQCGYPSILETIVESGETKEMCYWCGHIKNKTYSGTSEHYGLGTIHTTDIHGHTSVDALLEPLETQHQRDLLLSRKEDEVTGLYVWNEDKMELESLIGSLPMTLEAYYQQQIDALNYDRQFHRSYPYGLSEGEWSYF